MAFVESWIESDPDGSVITGSLLDDYQRQSKRAIRERLEGDPANPNSGIYEAASFGATSIVRAGTARAYAVTAAGVAALTLQDGRIAITTDTQRLFHLKGTGAIELGYIPLAGTAGNVTFGLVTSSLGYAISGNGTYAAAKMYKDAANGLILSGTSGSTYDLVLSNNAGSPVIRILTGTLNVSCPGTFTAINLTASGGSITGTLATAAQPNITSVGTLVSLAVTGNINGGAVLSSDFRGGGTVAASGAFKLANGVGLNWRNSTNTGDVAVLFVSGTGTNIQAETSVIFTAAAGVQASIDNTGVISVGFTMVDDQSKKLILGRFSAGTPWSYIKISTLSSGLRVTNAGASVDVMIIDNVGNVVHTGTGQFDGAISVAGSAAAVAAGYLSIGGNTSTTASTYGGGGVTALPAQPRGYIPIFLGATNFKIPYYVA